MSAELAAQDRLRPVRGGVVDDHDLDTCRGHCTGFRFERAQAGGKELRAAMGDDDGVDPGRGHLRVTPCALAFRRDQRGAARRPAHGRGTVHRRSPRRARTQEPARARHFARALREGSRGAARIATPTEAIAREVVDLLGIPRRRVRAIPHGVDPAFTPEGARRNWRRRYVLYVGALNARKGIDTLAAAFAALPERIRREHDLLVAGPRERGAPDVAGATVLGYVPEADLPALLRGAAAFCYPSRYEGFGLPLLEAMACGIPCAASDDPALVEVAGGAALHAPRGDAAALAGALERALDDESVRKELRARGPLRASAFTWERSALEHLVLYREALA